MLDFAGSSFACDSIRFPSTNDTVTLVVNQSRDPALYVPAT